MHISNEARQVVLGSLLGDGGLYIGDAYIEQDPKKWGNARFEVTHTTKQHLYIDWKARHLAAFRPTLHARSVKARVWSGQEYAASHNMTIITARAPYFKALHSKWYEPGTTPYCPSKRFHKVVPSDEILSGIDEMGLAVWYMDDGTMRQDMFAARLCTQGFSPPESERLCQWLSRQWGIEAAIQAINLRKVKSAMVGISTKSTPDFIGIVKPYVMQIPTMMHKLGIPEDELFHDLFIKAKRAKVAGIKTAEQMAKMLGTSVGMARTTLHLMDRSGLVELSHKRPAPGMHFILDWKLQAVSI